MEYLYFIRDLNTDSIFYERNTMLFYILSTSPPKNHQKQFIIFDKSPKEKSSYRKLLIFLLSF